MTKTTHAILSCYRYLQSPYADGQRVDGRLYVRKDHLIFEADFPSSHRVFIPYHQLLGIHFEPEEMTWLRLLISCGQISFYPTTPETTLLTFIAEIRSHWSPSSTLLLPNENTHSGRTLDLETTSLNTAPSKNAEMLAYLEGTLKFTKGETSHSEWIPCAVQVQTRSFNFLCRGETTLELKLDTITAFCCRQDIFQQQPILTIHSPSQTLSFRGPHALQLTGYLESVQRKAVPIQLWQDRDTWFTFPAVYSLHTTFMLRIRSQLFWEREQPVDQMQLEQIHTLDFQKGLHILSEDKSWKMGDRKRQKHYRQLVDSIMETIITLSPENVVGLWDSERCVHIGRIEIEHETLVFYPRNPNLSRLETALSTLWMPELHDISKPYLQIRMVTEELIPKWMIIHCGTATQAQEWATRLHLPSQRFEWRSLSHEQRNTLLLDQIVTVILPNEERITTTIQYRPKIDAPHSLFLMEKKQNLPVDTPIELWFTNQNQRCRMLTTIAYKQELPILQYALHSPTQIDVYNHRSHHRVQVHWSVTLIPLEWNPQYGWRLNTHQSYAATMKDISYTGCAIEHPEDLPEAMAWCIDIHSAHIQENLLAECRYQTQLKDSGVRCGFRFIEVKPEIVRALFSEEVEPQIQ